MWPLEFKYMLMSQGKQKHSHYICDNWKWQYAKVLMWNCQLGDHMID